VSEPVLERSVLERKDRDELLTIARALGAKPAARAKKADIVELILRTAGIIPASTEGDAATAPEEVPSLFEPTPSPEPRPEERAEVASNGNGGGGADDEDHRDEQGDTDDADDADDEHGGAHDDEEHDDEPVRVASAPQPVRGEGRPRPRPEQADRGERTGQPGQGGSSREGNRQDADGNRQERDGNRVEGDGNRRDAEPARDEDTDELGNRRGRRRRGRDRGDRDFRDRPDEPWTGEPVPVGGLLDLRDEGYGFLRTKGYLPSRDDVYVSVKQVRQFGLRKGDEVTGASRPASRNEKNPALLRIDAVNGGAPDAARSRPHFEDLTPLFPDEKLRLETPGGASPDMTARIIDLIAPIGKGQRGLIVSPPKAGKTTIMKAIVKAIETNNPDVHLMVLLVDERPEEVTDFRRSTKGEVVASTFDRPADEHTQLAELVIERAKRLVEGGRDVVIVLDGITRLARAYNQAAPATGRVMSGGLDSGALYPPKRFFGAARNVEEGGSLTILASALVETGSRMDEVIFEEFKGTGNMELRLDRRMAERRVYPAIDVDGSSTRHEELLFDRKQLQQVWRVRRAFHALSTDGSSHGAALERLLDGMKQYNSNEAFLAEAAKA
jgi:transcription termination factor Rho